jgi:hypothetical protein
MRVAGVRLADDVTIWVDVGDRVVSPLDTVRVRVPDGDVTGTVVVTPEQLLDLAAPVTGMLLQLERRAQYDPDHVEIPGSDLPYLGQRVTLTQGEGQVTALDVVGRIVTVSLGEGREVQIPAALLPAG